MVLQALPDVNLTLFNTLSNKINFTLESSHGWHKPNKFSLYIKSRWHNLWWRCSCWWGNWWRLSVSILASFCVWTKSLKCKDAVNRDSTFRVMSVVSACKSEEFQVPCQPSGCPSVHYSIRPDDVSSSPDARQTSIIRPDEVFIPSGPHTVSRSFCASLHPSRSFSSMSGCLPVLDQFLISFQVPRKGKISQPSGRAPP